MIETLVVCRGKDCLQSGSDELVGAAVFVLLLRDADFSILKFGDFVSDQVEWERRNLN